MSVFLCKVNIGAVYMTLISTRDFFFLYVLTIYTTTRQGKAISTPSGCLENAQFWTLNKPGLGLGTISDI